MCDICVEMPIITCHTILGMEVSRDALFRSGLRRDALFRSGLHRDALVVGCLISYGGL